MIPISNSLRDFPFHKKVSTNMRLIQKMVFYFNLRTMPLLILSFGFLVEIMVTKAIIQLLKPSNFGPQYNINIIMSHIPDFLTMSSGYILYYIILLLMRTQRLNHVRIFKMKNCAVLEFLPTYLYLDKIITRYYG